MRPLQLQALALMLALQTTSTVNAQPRDADPVHPHLWGLEADVVQPFIPQVHIVSLRATRTLWGDSVGLRGDLMFGVYVRPRVKHDIVDTIDEYLLSLGYRQYLWRGLHVEAALLGGWVWGTRNKIDGRDYSTPVLLGEAQVGYRFGFFEPGGIWEGDGSSVGFYLAPQFGVIGGLYTDIGPRGGKTDVFLEGKLLVGLSF